MAARQYLLQLLIPYPHKTKHAVAETEAIIKVGNIKFQWKVHSCKMINLKWPVGKKDIIKLCCSLSRFRKRTASSS